MNTKLLIIFIVLNVVNVIIQTIKSIATIKCGKTVAALVNAGTYALYTVVLVYTMCDLPLWAKATIVGLCNLVGVWVVKWGEEKARKDKLWKVELTVPHRYLDSVDWDLRTVPHSYIDIDKYVIFNFYCATQAESKKVKDIAEQYQAKYFVSESKTL